MVGAVAQAVQSPRHPQHHDNKNHGDHHQNQKVAWLHLAVFDQGDVVQFAPLKLEQTRERNPDKHCGLKTKYIYKNMNIATAFNNKMKTFFWGKKLHMKCIKKKPCKCNNISKYYCFLHSVRVFSLN